MDTTPEAQRAERRIEFARSSTDRMLLGVCGGVARRYGVDAYVVRIALLLLTLTGGLGVVLYVAGWGLSRSPDELPAPQPFEPGLVTTRSIAAVAASG
ncbi:MAG: PspC domain-containing protein, partial [Ilumatobacteraceae bacterium]|nr:PspC domain-containing protein [Ilumatobacteraceae bacterium]